MALPRLRTQEEIELGLEARLRAFSPLRDFTEGSVAKTTNEAVSLDLADGYHQIGQLLAARDLGNVTGSDLDREAEVRGVTPRLRATSSSCSVRVRDSLLVRAALRFDVVAGALSSQVGSPTPSAFPAAGPYTARIGEGTLGVEDVTVTSYTAGTGTFVWTAPGPRNAHSAGERVAIVSGGAARTFTAGSLRVRVPAANAVDAIEAVSTEPGTLVNGDYEGTDIRVQTVLTGAATRAATGAVTEFTSSPPFAGAEVVSTSPLAGGRDIESDDEFRDRIRANPETLSRGTRTALEQAALGTEDLVTGQRVATAHAVFDLETREVTVYVDDGSGMVPDSTRMASSVAVGAVAPGAAAIPVVDATSFPRQGTVLYGTEVLGYVNVNEGVVPHQLTLSGLTAVAHLDGEEVATVDVVTAEAIDGQRLFRTAQAPIVRGSLRLWGADSAGLNAALIPAANLFSDRGTGEIKVEAGVVGGSMVLAHYTSYAGLVRTVQQKLTGDPASQLSYPGTAALGVVCAVEVPTIRRVRIVLGIAPERGYTEDALRAPVREAVESYINGLRIGEEVVLESVRSAAKGVPGVYDVVQIVPSPDVTSVPVLENELVRSVSASGLSLIEVR